MVKQSAGWKFPKSIDGGAQESLCIIFAYASAISFNNLKQNLFYFKIKSCKFLKIFRLFERLQEIIFNMSALLRGSRSCRQDQARRERQRKLVLEALAEKQIAQKDDHLLLDLVTAIPRSTPQRIEEILAKMKKDDAQAAEQFEDALVHCDNLAENLKS